MPTKIDDLKSITNSDIAAIILAAGQSSRMGAFKPLLPFGKTTVIEHTIDYFQQAGIENIIVVVHQRVDEIRKRVQTAGVTLATNPVAQSPMIASIICGLRASPAQTRAFFITPVDQPAVEPAVVTSLINKWRAGARLLIPTSQGRGGHPVLIDNAFRDELLNLHTDSTLKTFFDTHRDETERVPVKSNYIARDLDTWDDYRALHKEVFGVFPPELPAELKQTEMPGPTL